MRKGHFAQSNFKILVRLGRYENRARTGFGGKSCLDWRSDSNRAGFGVIAFLQPAVGQVRAGKQFPYLRQVRAYHMIPYDMPGLPEPEQAELSL